jgi:hypothetical protein
MYKSLSHAYLVEVVLDTTLSQSPPRPGMTAKGILVASSYQGYANVTVKGFGDFLNYTTDRKLPTCLTRGKESASFLLTASAEVCCLPDQELHL